jgi:anti-sigma B factor antagonist
VNRTRPYLRVDRRDSAAGVLLDVRGEIDLATGDRFADGLRRAFTTAVATNLPLVVDLRGVSFMGAVGLGVLARTAEECGRAGVRLLVVADQPAVLRPMRITGLDRTLTVAVRGPAERPPVRNGTARCRHDGQ